MKIMMLLIIIILFAGCNLVPEKKVTQIDESYRCKLVPDAGNCEAAITKFYYDAEQGCTNFAWGGCDGTVPFETMDECLKNCG